MLRAQSNIIVVKPKLVNDNRRWQIITVSAIVTLVLGLALGRFLLGYQTDVVSVVDLGLGIVWGVLAMYVYYKERKLEEKVTSLMTNKVCNAYDDILINMIVFERTVDTMFINNHEANDVYFHVTDARNISRLYRNIRMVFVAHVDVMEKTFMGRLAQHISILETYTKDKDMEMFQHMDNMHAMDGLIDDISARLKNKRGKRKNTISPTYESIEHKENMLMRMKRQNRFMIFLLERIHELASSLTKGPNEELRRQIVWHQSAVLYYISDTNDMRQTVFDKLAVANRLIVDKPLPSAYGEYASEIISIIDLIKKRYEKEKKEQTAWVDQLADYSSMIGPIVIFQQILDDLSDKDSWKNTVNVYMSSILYTLEQECTHIPPDDRKHLADLFGSVIDSDDKDKCVTSLNDIVDYLTLKQDDIQKRHL